MRLKSSFIAGSDEAKANRAAHLEALVNVREAAGLPGDGRVDGLGSDERVGVMGVLRSFKAGATAIFVFSSPVVAQETAIDFAVDFLEDCLAHGDAAFEHSLRDGVIEEERNSLMEAYYTSPLECPVYAVRQCDLMAEPEGCIADLTGLMRAYRAEIVAMLPTEIDEENRFTAGRYIQNLSRAAGVPDEAVCALIADVPDAPPCEIMAEVSVLGDAYAAWRMAREAGAVPLVGHDAFEGDSLK